MHGNTTTTRGNRKTRSFERILEEVRQTHAGLRDAGVPLAGVHFEMTGQDVTECTGGAEELRDEDLEKNYTTYCDPRLNYAQSLEMAFLLSRLMQRG
jgi:3-deoxy-7-phosphoheptulonate synthase